MHSLTLVPTKSGHSLSHREREDHHLRYLVPKLAWERFFKGVVDAADSNIYAYSGKKHNPY